MRLLSTLQLQSAPKSLHFEDLELSQRGITLLFVSLDDSLIVFASSTITGFSSDKLAFLQQVMRTTGVMMIS